jgi:hypothetical protein
MVGRQHVEVTEQRAKMDWAWWTKYMYDEHHQDVALSVYLVMDNLNTPSALMYQTFLPEVNRRSNCLRFTACPTRVS